MIQQVLFSSKNKSKNLECCLLQFLFGALSVNTLSDLPDWCTGVRMVGLYLNGGVWARTSTWVPEFGLGIPITQEQIHLPLPKCLLLYNA